MKSSSLIILSYRVTSFNSDAWGRSVEMLTHSNQREKRARGTKDSLDREEIYDVLRDIQDVDRSIYRRDIFRSLFGGLFPCIERGAETHVSGGVVVVESSKGD